MFSVETLHFQRMKEAFHAGIIVAIALCAHTAILIMLLSRSEECLLILLFAAAVIPMRSVSFSTLLRNSGEFCLRGFLLVDAVFVM